MNWSDKNIWKQCFVSTFICLIGCSIGAMGTAFYLINYNLFFVLLVSLGVGFISCLAFMVIWHMLFSQMNLKDSLKSSYKMSIVSILIMMLTENLILLFIIPKFSSHQMQVGMDMGLKHDLGMMAIAMSFGFLFSLPYNYYQLQKTGKICHEH